ncbi:SH3 domain-containing protein [Macrococcoides canis]|uniref:SH3 domain-containing protein n=1 Tax=Macrococcoides canis TaxID=1855823 RepID=A0A1W7AC77_9STAP|nr:hypothetical protein [Macrococcus canis]ARQ07026.1 hypothetical protein MCCS_13850 [Macrococcus canis]
MKNKVFSLLMVMVLSFGVLFPSHEAKAVDVRPGPDSHIVSPKKCSVYSNKNLITVKSAIVDVASSKFKIKKQLVIQMVDKLLLSSTKKNYVCVWTYKAYNDKGYKGWYLYGTIVNYTDGTYKTPKKVQTYQIKKL